LNSRVILKSFPPMKRYLSFAFAFGFTVLLLNGQDDAARPATPLPADAAYFVALNQQLLERNAEFTLLTQLAQEHNTRADQAGSANQGEKAKWERDLSKELADKGSALLAQINELSQQRTAFEKTNKLAGSAGLWAGSTNGFNPSEVIYLARLEERAQDVERELKALVDQGNIYTLQLQTNNVPEEVGRVSFLLEDNRRDARWLQKERLDLELKRLEFRAVRRY
jgi:hypothetical protein